MVRKSLQKVGEAGNARLEVCCWNVFSCVTLGYIDIVSDMSERWNERNDGDSQSGRLRCSGTGRVPVDRSSFLVL